MKIKFLNNNNKRKQDDSSFGVFKEIQLIKFLKEKKNYHQFSKLN